MDATSVSGKIKREATVYDAVAGRVGTNGFLPTTPYASKNRDTLSSSIVPSSPEEVLFRRRAAPVRYEGQDFYFAHENLPTHIQLPSSELLKAIHQYASDFYSCSTSDRGQRDFRSLDETALIALGILIEESMKDTLGDAGDLVFTEPANLDKGVQEDKWTRAYVRGSVPKDIASSSQEQSSSSESDDTESEAVRSTKRPRYD
ncbi:MAG: hypothetical protein Q9160_002582 [Pyrenula sp. 1 TL-2023]